MATEIDRTLKKIQEGVDGFQLILDKFNEASTQSVKEKIELELKKEIKKLQRLRDQIKGWIASSDVKDKTVLWNYRRLVEVQMETFKSIEKEMKTKAYSREGLSSTKLEQKDKDKLAAFQWINSCIEKLSAQIETMEAEVENLLVGPTKKSEMSNSVEKLEKQISMHRWHIEKLEITLRMIQNESLAVENANKVRDDVEYYCDYFQEPDFMENEQLYDDLGLDHSSGPESDEDESEEEGAGKAAATSPVISNPPPATTSSTAVPANGFPKKTAQPKTGVAEPSAPVSAPTKPAPPTQTKFSTTANVQGSAAASFAAGTSTGTSKAGAQPAGSAKAPLMPSVTMATILSKNVENKQDAEPIVNTTPSANAPVKSPWVNAKLTETLLKGKQQTGIVEEGKKEEQISMEKLSLKEPPSGDAALPSVPYSFARLKNRPSGDVPSVASSINSAATCIPDIYEFERYYVSFALISCSRNKPYSPAFPLSQHPPTFPTNPPSIFESPSIFEKFDVDTLFFIFYFQPKTVQQYLAAKELKKHSWRFHKKYLTWFQRFEEPKIVNDDFEQGTYIYFDYEGSWCQRKKTEFTFEYRYLEDVELP